MFVKLTSFILLATLLTACGISAPEEDEIAANAGSSSKGVITSVASRNSSVSRTLSSSSVSSSRTVAVNSSSSAAASLASVIIQWEHPNRRENGEFLELDDIVGYDIRVLNPTTGSYAHYYINNNFTTQYVLPNYRPDMTVEIAVYDTTGLYSQYIAVTD